jgi:hypothetical protein
MDHAETAWCLRTVQHRKRLQQAQALRPLLLGTAAEAATAGLRACPSGSPHFRGPSWPPGAARAKSRLRVAASDTRPATNAMIAATSRMRSRPVVKAARVIVPATCLPGGQPCDHATDLPGLYRAGDLRSPRGQPGDRGRAGQHLVFHVVGEQCPQQGDAGGDAATTPTDGNGWRKRRKRAKNGTTYASGP